MAENRLNCIVIDNTGNKWIGTNDSGLVMFDDVNWTVYNQQNSSLGSNEIKALKIDNDIIWVGTYNGLYQRVNNDFIFIDAAGTRHINCLDKDVHGNTWIDRVPGTSNIISNGTIVNYDISRMIIGDKKYRGSESIDFVLFDQRSCDG